MSENNYDLLLTDEELDLGYGLYAHRKNTGYAPLWSHHSAQRSFFMRGATALSRFEESGVELFLLFDNGVVAPAPKTPELPSLEGLELFTQGDFDIEGWPDRWEPVSSSDVPRELLFVLAENGEYEQVPQKKEIYPGDDDTLWHLLACRVEDAEKISYILMDMEMCANW